MFNDGHVLQLWSETVAVSRRMIYDGHIITGDECMGGSLCDVSEEPVTYEKRKKGWRMSCDVGQATEGLENELWRR